MHIVTLSFDDGFRDSAARIAAIYERHGLRACFNVIATGHIPDVRVPDRYYAGIPMGDFALWNELQERGHEIMPHGYKHENKGKLPFEEGKKLILDCLDVFSRELDGFAPKKAIFNFPYNSSTPELEAWLPAVVKAFRTGGGGINPLPFAGQFKLTCTASGPGNCERNLDGEIEKLLAQPSGWLIYNTHGLDAEGWGPIGTEYLDRLLDRLLTMKSVRILPAGEALEMRLSALDG